MDLSLKINNYETGLWCYKNLIHKYFTHSINYKVFFSSLQLSSLFGYNSSYKSLNNCYFHLINDIPSIYNSVIIKQTYEAVMASLPNMAQATIRVFIFSGMMPVANRLTPARTKQPHKMDLLPQRFSVRSRNI